LARILRIIRTMETFQKLRVLMHTIILSFLSIFWSMMILFIFMVVGALFMTQLLQEFIVDRSYEDEIRIWMSRYYGSSLSSLYTVFEMTFSGGWPNYARRLVEEVSPWFCIFFVLYVTLVVFTLVRIIFALLIRDTMQAATNEACQVAREKASEKTALIEKLRELFRAADTSGDGFLSREEFDRIVTSRKVQEWMSSLGMDVHDHEDLFGILTEDEPSEKGVSWEEFVHGIMRMKGSAREQDVLCNMRDIRRILKHCQALRSEVSSLAATMSSGAQPHCR